MPDIDVPWEDSGLDSPAFTARHNTNCYTRRTDDVVWLWAAHDLSTSGSATVEDWAWLYDHGNRFFRRFMTPFFGFL